MKITNKDQSIVANILNEISFCSNLDEISEQINEFAKHYMLGRDPYTKCYCSSKDEEKYIKQYNRELMTEKYGHFDGLE